MTAIAAIRDALTAVLPGGNIDPDHAHAFPAVGGHPTPCAWVGRPTVRSGGAGRGASVSFPIAVAVDGAREGQLALLDLEVARLWDALRTVTAPSGGKADVSSATPEQFGGEGSTVLGAVLTVTVDLYVTTLCTPTIS